MYSARYLGSVAILAMSAAVCSAQTITAAHSGTLHYSEGSISIDGVAYKQQVSKFPEIKEQSVLSTGLGRAEVLLTPGVFLRLGENSSIRMLDTRLVSTRVDILGGSVTVESDDPQLGIKNSPVTLLYKDYDIHMVSHGLIEITSDPAQMKVFKGEAVVTTADNRATIKDGHLMPFGAGLTAEKFDDKTGDDLYLWTRDRSGDLSAANMSSARSISAGCNSFLGNCAGATGAGASSGAWGGGWYYNPYFGMYTYVPGAGTIWNPFGYGFFSPGSIYGYYSPTSYWYGGGGARGAVAGQALATAGGPTTRLAAPLSSLRSSAGSAPTSTLSSPLASPAPGGSTLSSGGAAGSGGSRGSLSGGVATRAGGGRR